MVDPTVHRYLITTPIGEHHGVWMATGSVANWLEGRENGEGRETWLVTVFSEDAELVLDAARKAGVTVQEVLGAGDTHAGSASPAHRAPRGAAS